MTYKHDVSIRAELRNIISTYRNVTPLETPEPTMRVPNIEDAALVVAYNLERLGPSVAKSDKSRSHYVRFKNIRHGTIRISDHPGYVLSHEWNLRFDLKRAYVEWYRGGTRYFYPAKDVNSMCAKILATHWKH